MCLLLIGTALWMGANTLWCKHVLWCICKQIVSFRQGFCWSCKNIQQNCQALDNNLYRLFTAEWVCVG